MPLFIAINDKRRHKSGFLGGYSLPLEKKNKSVTIVIPAYNEEDRIKRVIEDYARVLEALRGDYEILVVCNGCTDRTEEIVEGIGISNPRVRSLSFKERLGKGGAIIEGFKEGKGDLVGFVDADQSTGAEEYLKLIHVFENPLIDGAVASRRAKGAEITVHQSLGRRIAGRIFNIIVRGLFGLSLKDTQCGAKLFKREAVMDVVNELQLKGYEFDVELLWKLKRKGYVVEEVPIKWWHEKGSKFSLLRGPGMLLRLLKMRVGEAPPSRLLGYALPLVILFGLGLRLYPALMVPVTNPDGLLYSWLAVNLAEGNGFTIAGGESLSEIRAWRVPVFPLTLAFFYKILGSGFFVSKIPSLIFGGGTIIVTYLLAQKLFSKKEALLSALFVGFTPFMALSSATIMTESMYAFFLVTSLYFMLSPGPGKKSPFLAGALVGLAYLTRTIGMTLLLLGVVYYLYRREGSNIPPLLLGFALLAVPWWAWSFSEYGNAFAAERYSSEYQFYLEFGSYPVDLNMLTYLFSYHSLAELFTGMVDGGIELGLYLAFSLAFIGFIPVIIGIPAGRDRSVDLLLLGTVLIGVMATAWQAHLQMYPRYVVPYLPVLTLYLGKGIVSLYRGEPSARRFANLVVVIMLIFSVGAIAAHVSRINETVQREYMGISSGIPRDTPVLASNPRMAEKVGFDNAYPLGGMGFGEILAWAKDKNTSYILVDSSSIHNNDQFYLVTHWYKSRVPKGIEYAAGASYHPTLYRIKVVE